LVAPFFTPGMLRHTLFVSLQLVMLPSMFTEATLETQYGLTIYLFFTLLFLRFWSTAEAKETLPAAAASRDTLSASAPPWQKKWQQKDA
jgi:hypothetical protein